MRVAPTARLPATASAARRHSRFLPARTGSCPCRRFPGRVERDRIGGGNRAARLADQVPALRSGLPVRAKRRRGRSRAHERAIAGGFVVHRHRLAAPCASITLPALSVSVSFAASMISPALQGMRRIVGERDRRLRHRQRGGVAAGGCACRRSSRLSAPSALSLSASSTTASGSIPAGVPLVTASFSALISTCAPRPPAPAASCRSHRASAHLTPLPVVVTDSRPASCGRLRLSAKNSDARVERELGTRPHLIVRQHLHALPVRIFRCAGRGYRSRSPPRCARRPGGCTPVPASRPGCRCRA